MIKRSSTCDPEIWHITPINDADVHSETVNFSDNKIHPCCRCNPAVDYLENGDILVIHHSFDGRENFEPDNAVRLN
jgi:hypothetical protein